MRTRRKRRNNWFPVLGLLNANEELSVGAVGSLQPQSTGVAFQGGPTLITPLIPDFAPEDTSAGDDTLTDYIGNEYVIERIVGKAHFALRQSNTDGDQAVLAAGLFVARVDDSATSPIRAAADVSADYGPLNPRTYQRPWMWRRTWAMTNLSASAVQGIYPATTSQGSVLDGQHIDCKSKRRVRKDERLFLAVQAMALNFGTTGVNLFQGTVDLRVLGRLVKAKNKSAF